MESITPPVQEIHPASSVAREAKLLRQRDNALEHNRDLRQQIIEAVRINEKLDDSRMAEIGFKLDARDRLEKANEALMKHVLIFDEIFKCLDTHRVFGDSITERVAALGELKSDLSSKVLMLTNELSKHHHFSHLKEPEMEHCDICKALKQAKS